VVRTLYAAVVLTNTSKLEFAVVVEEDEGEEEEEEAEVEEGARVMLFVR